MVAQHPLTRIACALVVGLAGCAQRFAQQPAPTIAPRARVVVEAVSPDALSDAAWRAEATRFEAQSRACARGGLDACVAIAEWLADGRGAARDFPEARRRLEELCAADAPRACAALARVNVWSFMPEVARSGRALAERECARGMSEGCIALSDARALGLGGAIERDSIEAPLDAPCRAGSLEACAARALVRVSRDRPSRDAEAVSLCARGFARACLAAATIERDPARSLAGLERACELGDARGCARAAERYRTVARLDVARAESLAVRGCLQLVPSAGCRAWIAVNPTRFYPEARVQLLDRACHSEREPHVCLESVRAALHRRPDSLVAPTPFAVLASWVGPSCATGSVDACVALGAIEVTDRATVARGEERLRAGCARDHPFACAELATLWSSDTSRSLEALGLSRRACMAGEVLGCRSFVLARENTQRAVRDGASMALFEIASRGCALGDSESCAVAAERASTPARARAFEARQCALTGSAGCADAGVLVGEHR